MKRKLIYLFLVGLTFGFVGFTNANAEELTPTKEWCFAFDDETGTITGYMYKNYSYYNCGYDVVIPETIRGVEVKRIGNKAFMNDNIESVVIPDTVTSIGNLAFASNDFCSEVVIPDTVTKIGYGAFNDNEYLLGTDLEYLYARTDVNNDGIAEIDNTKLIGVAYPYDEDYELPYNYGAIIVPSQVKTIGTKAFYGISTYDYEGEIYLYLPSGLETIEDKAFYGSAITDIDVPSSLKTADFSIDPEQIPYAPEVIYHNWFTWKAEETYEEYVPYEFESGIPAFISREIFYRPEVYYTEGKSVAYNKVKISYYGDGDIDGIEIWRYDNASDEYKKYRTIYTENTDSYFYVSGLTTGKTYYFKVRSFTVTPDNVKHYSDFPYRVAIKPKPSTPTKVNATKYKSGVAKITWNKVDGATGYAIYKYNKNTKKYYFVKRVTGTSTTTSSGLTSGKSTYYKVRAYRTVDGKRIYSNYSASDYVKV